MHGGHMRVCACACVFVSWQVGVILALVLFMFMCLQRTAEVHEPNWGRKGKKQNKKKRRERQWRLQGSHFSHCLKYLLEIWKVRGKKNEQEKDKTEKGWKKESWIRVELKKVNRRRKWERRNQSFQFSLCGFDVTIDESGRCGNAVSLIVTS